MAIAVKDAAAAAQKFVSRAQAAVGDYTKGVQAAGEAWLQGAAASEDSFSAGVQDAIQRKAYSKGVQKAGANGYVSAASGKGSQRYTGGVAGAGPAWQNGTTPFLQTIAGLQLPPRGPKGDPRNMARVSAVTEALRKKKLGM